MTVYHIPYDELTKFRQPGVGFMPFNQFGNVVQKFRDERYAAENIVGFQCDIGRMYNLWTCEANGRYLRNLLFDQVEDGVSIAFSVPSVKTNAVFPLRIRIFDEAGIFFQQVQTIAVEKKIGSSDNGSGSDFRLTAWRKVPTISDFVMSEFERGGAST